MSVLMITATGTGLRVKTMGRCSPTEHHKAEASTHASQPRPWGVEVLRGPPASRFTKPAEGKYGY